MTDNLTKKQRRFCMSKIRSKDTKPEIVLADELKKKRVIFKRNFKGLLGTPDFVFVKQKLIVFCDSEFFHGKNWKKNRMNIRSNREYWIPKIESNIKRDKKIRTILRNSGWRVIKFWGRDVVKNPANTASKIINNLKESRLEKNES